MIGSTRVCATGMNMVMTDTKAQEKRVSFVYLLVLAVVVMRLQTWNIRGVMYGTPYLCNTLQDTDICCITEHWLMPEQLTFLNSIDTNFRAFGRCDSRIEVEPENRTMRGFGGVAMLWHSKIKATPLLQDGNDRIVGICVKTDNSYLYIIGVLMPSTNLPLCEFRDTMQCLSDLYDKYIEMGTVVVMGDLNAHLSLAFGEKNTWWQTKGVCYSNNSCMIDT